MKVLTLCWALPLGLTLGLTLGLGCGDALIADDFRGEPLLTIQGQVNNFDGSGLVATTDEPVVALFWAPRGDVRASLSELIEQRSASAEVDFPARFEIRVFQPPGAEHMVAGKPYAISAILVYQDVDGDGRLSGDELRGGDEGHVVVWAERDLGPSETPTQTAWKAGLQIVKTEQLCDLDFAGSRNPKPCGVPLGAACTQDADCGAQGRCLKSTEFEPLPGGYCVVDAETCLEAEGVIVEVDGADYVLDDCVADADCRVSEGYVCDELRSCWPDAVVRLDMDGSFIRRPLCAQEL